MKNKNYSLELSYTTAQHKLFWESQALRRIVRKGRRVGFTRGAAQYVIEGMLDGTYSKVLWGDTIHQNIRNYVERYFMPVLRQIPPKLWSWRVTDKLLTINTAVCDFRSADNPENWEGFGYDLVILNEAGIILKNRYLWENAVAPMLLDNPDSVCIIGGTPKGKGLFYELWSKASEVAMREDVDSGLADSDHWDSFAFSTFDNPLLSKSAVEKLISELGGSESVIRQEIYGEFIDNSSNELFSYSKIMKAMRTGSESYLDWIPEPASGIALNASAGRPMKFELGYCPNSLVHGQPDGAGMTEGEEETSDSPRGADMRSARERQTKPYVEDCTAQRQQDVGKTNARRAERLNRGASVPQAEFTSVRIKDGIRNEDRTSEWSNNVSEQALPVEYKGYATQLQKDVATEIVIWGVDVARHGGDQSVVAMRSQWGLGQGAIYNIIRKDTPDLMVFADFIAHLYAREERKPEAIFVEINGMGAGLYDRLVQLGLPALSADVASRAMQPKVFNKRSEMYKAFAKAVDKGLALPDDRRLQAELSAVEYEIADDGVFKILPKDKIKAKLGYSPDSADACALTFFAPVSRQFEGNTFNEHLPTGAW